MFIGGAFDICCVSVITNLVLRMMLFLICHSTVMHNASKHNHHIRLGLMQRKVTSENIIDEKNQSSGFQ